MIQIILKSMQVNRKEPLRFTGKFLAGGLSRVRDYLLSTGQSVRVKFLVDCLNVLLNHLHRNAGLMHLSI